MNCNCEHCLEMKRQLNRAQKRQSQILKSRDLKPVIPYLIITEK